MGFLDDIDDLQRTQRLLAHGRPGSATIAALREHGSTGDDDPTVEFELEVTVDGAAAYLVTHRQSIPRIALESYVPGRTVTVRVDPADPAALVIG